jgi:hypothetical protein
MQKIIRLGNVKGISNLEENIDGWVILKLELKKFVMSVHKMVAYQGRSRWP